MSVRWEAVKAARPPASQPGPAPVLLPQIHPSTPMPMLPARPPPLTSSSPAFEAPTAVVFRGPRRVAPRAVRVRGSEPRALSSRALHLHAVVCSCVWALCFAVLLSVPSAALVLVGCFAGGTGTLGGREVGVSQCSLYGANVPPPVVSGRRRRRDDPDGCTYDKSTYQAVTLTVTIFSPPYLTTPWKKSPPFFTRRAR